jgi:hypothetical protein
MALSPDHVAALIDLRVAELRELAAWTAVECWHARPSRVRALIKDFAELARRS